LIPGDFLPGTAEVVVRGKSSSSGLEEVGEEEVTFSPSLYDYLNEHLDSLHSEGLMVEISSKAGSSSKERTYFTQWVSLPLILEGSISQEVWVR